MAKYPNPCEKCKNNKNNNCTSFRSCQRWLARYRYRQKRINGYDKIHLPGYEVQRDVKTVTMPQSPCKTCTRVKDPMNCSNRNCADWKKWYLNRQKQINGYAKKNLPDYEERKKEGIHYDDED